MRRCSSCHAPGLVTRGQIAAGLADLGLSAGDTVMLHASVGAIGWIVGGADQVVRAVIDVIGNDGTLMMVAGWDGSPYDVTLDLPSVPPALAEAWPAYDPASSHAVREWSVLAEILRLWPGAVRSAHPDSSFVAVGPRADELVGEHPLQYGMGERSPLGKLVSLNGRVLLLGAPLASVTLLHHAEHLADVPDKRVISYWVPILDSGGKRWVRMEEFDTNGCLPWYGHGDMFATLLEDYVQAGRGAIGTIGAARSYLFEADDVVRFAVDWIEERFRDPVDRDLTIEVRPAGPAEHHEVVSLLSMMEEELPRSIAPVRQLGSRADEILTDRERRTFIARVDGQSVGILVVRRSSQDRGTMEVAFVDPAYRRRGVLRELEIDGAGYLRDAGCCTVDVRVGIDNEAGGAAWRSLGYAPAEEFLERPL